MMIIQASVRSMPNPHAPGYKSLTYEEGANINLMCKNT